MASFIRYPAWPDEHTARVKPRPFFGQKITWFYVILYHVHINATRLGM